ncbi:MAG: tetratricopeptide repeat protein [Gallionellaceae bacterium]|nr:tetratricopeptide repeat protein [Gallionellaceae bacterium]
MDLFSVTSDSVFTLSTQNTAQKENLALRALNTGLEQFSAKQYDLAVTSFQRSISMAPTADSALNAYDYMARAQLTQGKTQAAIDSYNKALKIAPNRDDLHVQLGKIYTTQGRVDDARAQYQLAVKYNPSSANRYALGQGLLGAGQYGEAIQQFELVRQKGPKEPYGNFGLGQTYAKQGRYDEAITSFKNAVAIKQDYLEAYSEMGYAYTDSGNIAKANDVVSTLNTLSPGNTTLATNLGQYIFEKTQPKMTAAYVSDLYTPFLASQGPSSKLSSMSNYLTNAGDEHTFAMVFQFDKAMNQNSVQNVFNWNIARAGGTGRGDGYNYDMTLPGTEVTLPSTPLAVYYDQKEQTATVLFRIRQNATANGTLDPSHINFSFTGKDVVGLSMDKSADMFSGYSGFA